MKTEKDAFAALWWMMLSVKTNFLPIKQLDFISWPCINRASGTQGRSVHWTCGRRAGRLWERLGAQWPQLTSLSRLYHAAPFSVRYFTFSSLAICSSSPQTSVGFVVSAVTMPPVWIGVYGAGIVASSVGSSPNMCEALRLQKFKNEKGGGRGCSKDRSSEDGKMNKMLHLFWVNLS